MAFIGPIIPPNLTGVGPRSRDAEKARERKLPPRGDDAFQRTLDEAEISAAAHLDAAGEVRSIKANDAEESREDRASSARYDPRGGSPPSDQAASLDIEG